MSRKLIIVPLGMKNELNPTPNITEACDLYVMSYADHAEVAKKYSFATKIIELDTSAPGMKYFNIHKHLSVEDLLKYDFVCVADDDLVMDFEELSRFMDVMREDGIDLAQLSLTRDSSHSFPMTVNDGGYGYRLTNFVEVMAPIFSNYAIRRLYGTFGMNKSSWGLDYLWAKWLVEEGRKIAICDEYQMRHMRPVASTYPEGVLMRASADLGHIVASYGIDQTHIVYGRKSFPTKPEAVL